MSACNCKLSIKAFTITSSLLWALSVLVVGMINIASPTYGDVFLDLLASVYPGYDALPSVLSVAIATGYAVLDGAVGGFLFALIYNLCKKCQCPE